MAGREGGGHRSVQGRALAARPRDGGRANGSVLDASESGADWPLRGLEACKQDQPMIKNK